MVLAVVVLIAVVWLVRGSGGGNSAPTASGTVTTTGSSGVTSTTPSGPLLTGELGTTAPASLTGVLADDTATPSGSATNPTAGSEVPGSTVDGSETAAATGSGVADTGATTAAPTTAPVTTSAVDPEVSGSVELEAQKSREAELKDAQQQAEAAAKAAERKVAEVKAKIKAEAAKEKAAKEKAAKAKAEAEAAAAELASRQYDAQGQLICPSSFITLTAVLANGSFPVGTKPDLGVSVQNVGDLPCVQDVSGSLQQFEVFTKAGAHVWSTQDCFPGTGTELRVFQPGETVQYSVIWAGTTSTPGCVGTRTAAPAGDYSVQARIGSLASPKLPFRITAG